MGKHTGARTSGIVVNAWAKVTGGRTGNIVGVLGPGLPVHAPAALWNCWDEGLGPRAGISRKGDQPQNWREKNKTPKHHSFQNPISTIHKRTQIHQQNKKQKTVSKIVCVYDCKYTHTHTETNTTHHINININMEHGTWTLDLGPWTLDLEP